VSDKPWTVSGPNVYDEHGEWIADCRVPNIYSQACVEANAQQIADDHNEAEQRRRGDAPTDFTVRLSGRDGILIALADDPDELLIIHSAAEARRVATVILRLADEMERLKRIP
jgi:hypothetical protein